MRGIRVAVFLTAVGVVWDSGVSSPSRGAESAAQTEVRAPASTSSQSEIVIKAWAVLMQGIAAIQEYVQTAELSAVHSEDVPVSMALSFLDRERTSLQPDVRDRVSVELQVFRRKLSELHAAADAFDQLRATELLTEVRALYDATQRVYPQDVLAAASTLAQRHTCPMHPDVVGEKAGHCPKCGMKLEQPVRVPLYYSGGAPATQTVSADIRTMDALQPGRRVDGVLRMTSFGKPVIETDLRVVHTEKIHLLIIDPTLSDYHHVHPRLTETPGEYAFSFTPRKAGSYRAWADVRTTSTGLQEFATADIVSHQQVGGAPDTSVNLRSEAQNLRFQLSFVAEPRAAQPVKGKVSITDAAGQPFRGLEPVMGSFAHLVAFNEDYKTVLHMHPRIERVLNGDDRGGPELEFQMYATRPGFYRLFAQVQVAGESHFAPFGLQILPPN